MVMPRKTIQTKKAQGTLEKSRELEHHLEHDILRMMPPVAKDLNEDGKKWFNHFVQIMINKGLMTTAFIQDFEIHAFIYQSIKEFERDLNKEGYWIVASTKWRQPNLAWKQIIEGVKTLTSFYQRYGLDLVSSQRIAVPDIGNDELDN